MVLGDALLIQKNTTFALKSRHRNDREKGNVKSKQRIPRYQRRGVLRTLVLQTYYLPPNVLPRNMHRITRLFYLAFHDSRTVAALHVRH